jgi:hypothetical protein
MPKSKVTPARKKSVATPFFHTRRGMALLGVVGLVAAYLVGLRATDTGSLQQYGLIIVLLIFAGNRLVRAIHPH